MSFPTGLFAEAPDLQDVTMHQLGEDVEAWPEEIVQKFKERVPHAANMNLMVKFMKKDDENGTATGSVVVSTTEKQAIVPTIVKDFMLFPMDVFIAGGKLLPLTQQFFDSFFSKNEVFHNLEEYPTFGGLGRFEDSNLWNVTYPPSLGRYAYASAGYEILDQISDTIDVRPFRDYLIKNPLVAIGFQKHGHAEVIKKLASLVNANEFRPGKDKLVQKNIFMLRREAPSKYSILANSDKVFSPVLTKLDLSRHELEKFVSKVSDCAADDINDVDQNGEKVLKAPKVEDDSQVYIERGQSVGVEKANEFDHYIVRKKNGVEVEGLVIPKVIDLDQEPVDLKLFIGKDLSTMQKEIAGVRKQNSQFRLPFSQPRTGQTGTFVYMPDKSHALATVPFTVVSITQHGECPPEFKLMDLTGRAFKVRMSGGDWLKRIVLQDGVYELPGKFKWVPMEGFDEVTNSAVDFAAKTAGAKTASPVKIMATGANRLAIKGVDKYAEACGWDQTSMEPWQLKFILTSLGASQEKIAAILEDVNTDKPTIVHGLARPKLASEMPKSETMGKLAKALRRNLIKEASVIDNAQTVDALLSLNFVNPDNISKFVGKLPSLKAAVSQLASLLIASRLGVREIPEHSASTAMMKMVEVIQGLEALRATQEVKQ
jgi:hypothetical protein